MKFRSLSVMMDEIICDNILRKFEGNKHIARERVRDRSFYENLSPDYSVVEDHINFLITDNMLQETESTISLTIKGWFILTNADKVGYVAQKIESVERENSEKESRLIFTWATIMAGATLAVWLIQKLVFINA
ncbi:MAG: hypothetical protein OEV74_09265 [Cyclobacteriaceae bacterium]|nr:hypothetical protein [Cyclobacteriaceae bacterium]MDH4296456.1 hypothetical protein [Cyclobacteriaceae bacterium]